MNTRNETTITTIYTFFIFIIFIIFLFILFFIYYFLFYFIFYLLFIYLFILFLVCCGSDIANNLSIGKDSSLCGGGCRDAIDGVRRSGSGSGNNWGMKR